MKLLPFQHLIYLNRQPVNDISNVRTMAKINNKLVLYNVMI
jgi:hypothetical protein